MQIIKFLQKLHDNLPFKKIKCYFMVTDMMYALYQSRAQLSLESI